MLRFSAALLVCAARQFSQAAPEDDVRRLLVYREYPTIVELSAAQKADAIARLRALQRTATGKQRQQIAFLLALLGHDYARNRNYLVGTLHRCAERDDDCSEDTADLLVGLYYKGHREVLYPLLTAGPRSDGALAASLGTFYGAVLLTSPSEFIAGLRRFDLPDQNSVCRLAGGGDGGGIGPALPRVRRILGRIGNAVALGCLRNVEEANQSPENR